MPKHLKEDDKNKVVVETTDEPKVDGSEAKETEEPETPPETLEAAKAKKKEGEESDEDEEGDDGEDEDEKTDESAGDSTDLQAKRESLVQSHSPDIDLDTVAKALEAFNFDQSQLNEFSAVLKQLIIESASDLAATAIAEAEKRMQAEFDAKLEAIQVETDQAISSKMEEFQVQHESQFSAVNEAASAMEFRKQAEALFTSFFAESSRVLLDDKYSQIVRENEELNTRVQSIAAENLTLSSQLLLTEVETIKAELLDGFSEATTERLTAMFEDIEFTTAVEFRQKASRIVSLADRGEASKKSDRVQKLTEQARVVLETTEPVKVQKAGSLGAALSEVVNG